MREERLDERFLRLLRIVAPGTPLREGIENILRARTGALLVVGDSPQVMALVDGGFKIDADFVAASLYELAKMDGAIILSADARRILYANAQLVPDPSIPSQETGIRHRTAERVARQTGELVIAISQRRNIISLYRGPVRYVLRDIGFILTKANQALQTLSRYRSVLDQALVNLSALEFEDLVTAHDVVTTLERAGTVLRIEHEIRRYVVELGGEGRLIQMQLQELVEDVAEDALLIARDYTQFTSHHQAEELRQQLLPATADEAVDAMTIGRLTGLGSTHQALEQPVAPRGYRILRKIPRLPMAVIENLVARFGNLLGVLEATVEQLDDVEGIGEVRAQAIQAGLRRLREQVLLERHI